MTIGAVGALVLTTDGELESSVTIFISQQSPPEQPELGLGLGLGLGFGFGGEILDFGLGADLGLGLGFGLGFGLGLAFPQPPFPFHQVPFTVGAIDFTGVGAGVLSFTSIGFGVGGVGVGPSVGGALVGGGVRGYSFAAAKIYCKEHRSIAPITNKRLLYTFCTHFHSSIWRNQCPIGSSWACSFLLHHSHSNSSCS